MTIDPTVLIAVIGTLASALGIAARMIYNDLRTDRDMWREMAMRGTSLAEQAIAPPVASARRR